MLYWSYRRARPIWLASLGLGALLFFVGRTESNPAMGFALLLVYLPRGPRLSGQS